MKYRTFGKNRITVSEVGFGVWTVSAGWWGEFTDEEATAMLRRAFDMGITLFDTADTYGAGKGESVLAQAFPGSERSKIVISTKFGYDFYNNTERRGQQERPHDWSPDFIRFACEQSLKRLETDYIDHYALHNPRFDGIQNDDVFAVLEDLQAAGKIRSYGVALGPAIGWQDEGLDAMRTRPIEGLQTIYNLFEQDPGRAFFPVARERDVAIMVRVPHSSGMLEGKYTAETVFAANDHRRHRPKEWLSNGLKKLEALDFLTQGQTRTLGQVALKFILAEPSVVTTLPNIYNIEQLEEFATACETPDLTAEEMARLDDLFAVNFVVEETKRPLASSAAPASSRGAVA